MPAAIRVALQATSAEIIDCATLEEATEKAAELAQAGDAVLLSPACASLDMFRNYAHQSAGVCRYAVREIGMARGEVAA
jgi:UDP-N-acetylmuramoylalanine--D-glutamate ligase